MSINEKLKKMLIDNGMLEEQANKILIIAEEKMKKMKGRWEEPELD